MFLYFFKTAIETLWFINQPLLNTMDSQQLQYFPCGWYINAKILRLTQAKSQGSHK
jgi:hypothetical protein